MRNPNIQGKVIVGDPQAVITQAADLFDLLEYRIEISAAEQIAKDRPGAKIATEGTPKGRDDGSGFRAIHAVAILF